MHHRLTDADAIEQRFLDLAFTTDVEITAPALAYHAPCSVDDAARVLEGLAAQDRLQMDIKDDGAIVYVLQGRQRLAAPALPRATVVTTQAIARSSSPTLAALLSVFIPGAGHLYAGRVVSALLWFLVVSAGYVLLVPGLILHMFNIVSAAGVSSRDELDRQIRSRIASRSRSPSLV